MISSRRNSSWTALALVVAVSGLAGCLQETAAVTSPESTHNSAQWLSKDSSDGARPGFPGGPEHLVVAALRELDLTPTQKTTIEAAIEKAKPEPRERGPKAQAVFAALAEGVRAGKLDAASVLAKADGDDGVAGERDAAAASALDTLHATLTKEQRRALVDAIGKRVAERGPGGEHAGKKGGRGPGGRGMAHGGPLGHLLHGLDLTDAQRADVERTLEAQRPAHRNPDAMKQRFGAMHTEMAARLETFAADTFDAKAFVKGPAGLEGPGAGGRRQHLEQMVRTLSAVLPILQPVQREKLAAQLEKGPTMGPRPDGLGRHSAGAAGR